MFQQQLVYKDSELLDDFCLQEYKYALKKSSVVECSTFVCKMSSIPHGARLQLLLTMRGGPIHASRSEEASKVAFLRLHGAAYFDVVYLDDSFCHELDSRYRDSVYVL